MTHALMPPLVHETLAHVAARQPDAIAVACRGASLTYAQLMARASRLADRLRAAGVGRGTLVGLGVARSPDMIVAMLGAWMAGAAYVPVEPESPRERRLALLADAKAALVMTDAAHAREWAAWRALVVDADDGALGATDEPARGDDLAYVLYTSGSTGAPKGVMVDHAALAARIAEMQAAFDVGPGDRVSQFPSIGWDASLFDIFVALANGAALHVAVGDERAPGASHHRFLRESRITATLMPPSVLAALPEEPLPDLRILFLGGEAVTAGLVDRWGQGRRVFNLYGPTETTVWCTTAECRPGEAPTIGRPVGGAYARVLDRLRAARPGEAGEICIGGAGLARGYLGREDLTAERWIADPLQPDRTLYRTGDLGRFLPDGRLQFLGRMDRQVKVRGARVEPAEVEAALASHPLVRDAAVEPEAAPSGETRLVAYVALRDARPTDAPRRMTPLTRRELRTFLAARLLDPMIPSVFVEMPALPLTPNGKVDRRALPPARPLLAADAVEPPRDPIERIVADAWAQALGLDAVGLHESFFDLGGHSLLVADVQARLAATLGRPVEAVALFEHPTVAQLARHLAGEPEGATRVPVQDAEARANARLAARGRRRPRPDEVDA